MECVRDDKRVDGGEGRLDGGEGKEKDQSIEEGGMEEGWRGGYT